jgi:hypothetical protein
MAQNIRLLQKPVSWADMDKLWGGRLNQEGRKNIVRRLLSQASQDSGGRRGSPSSRKA